VGKSANLTVAECTAWASLCDATSEWKFCRANRFDGVQLQNSVGCSYTLHGDTFGVKCSPDGQHILKLGGALLSSFAVVLLAAVFSA
jgi:hypothetical protein